MLYFIKIRPFLPVKIVYGDCVETIERAYPTAKIYRYRETMNPVTVPNSYNGQWRAAKEVLPNIECNKWCCWK